MPREDELTLLGSLPIAERKRVVGASALRGFAKGDVIFREGEPARSVWIVRSGWVYLVKRTPQGGRATIFAMTPDEALCGISAFDHGTYSAGAVAATRCELLQIPAELFASLLERSPAFTKQVLLTCCQRIRQMAEAISLAQAPVERRLIYVLWRLSNTFGATIPITHRELAQMAGTRWETSIRTLTKLKRQGWLASSRGKIRILHPETLRALLNSSHG